MKNVFICHHSADVPKLRDLLDNLKSKGFVKSELVLKVVDRDKMIAFIYSKKHEVNNFRIRSNY